MTTEVFKRRVSPANMVRVNKSVARKLYDLDHNVVMVSCKMVPFGPWHLGYSVNKYDMIERATCESNSKFDNIARDYAFYNCTYETGYYPAYYVHRFDVQDHKLSTMEDDNSW